MAAAVLIFGAFAAPATARPVQESPPLPAPDVALPSDPDALAGAFTGTARRLRDAVGSWDPAAPVPEDVTLLALHHQRMLRLMSAKAGLGDATLARLPHDVLGEARDTVAARRRIDAIPRGRAPKVRVAGAAPAATLRDAYAEAERRFGVPWSVLAAVNFVESAFGRVRSASEAGARGPMQFLPATWRQYGMGGDIDDPRDAILGAANLLRGRTPVPAPSSDTRLYLPDSTRHTGRCRVDKDSCLRKPALRAPRYEPAR